MNVKNSKKTGGVKPVTRIDIAPDQLVAEIRKRAHEIFLKRGPGPGSDLDDWLKAEREVKEKYGIKI